MAGRASRCCVEEGKGAESGIVVCQSGPDLCAATGRELRLRRGERGETIRGGVWWKMYVHWKAVQGDVRRGAALHTNNMGRCGPLQNRDGGGFRAARHLRCGGREDRFHLAPVCGALSGAGG